VLKRGKVQRVVMSVLTVMLLASLLLAVVSLLAPARKALAGPVEPEGYCDYFWECWKLVGCVEINSCPAPTGCQPYYEYWLYWKYWRYAGACEACPSPCCWRDAFGASIKSCDGNLGTCPPWCPGDP